MGLRSPTVAHGGSCASIIILVSSPPDPMHFKRTLSSCYRSQIFIPAILVEIPVNVWMLDFKCSWCAEKFKKKGKVCIQVQWPIKLVLTGVLSVCMKQLGVFLVPCGWDVSLLQGYPQREIHQYWFVHLGWGAVRVKWLVQEYNRMTPVRARTQTKSRALADRPLHLPYGLYNAHAAHSLMAACVHVVEGVITY